MSSPEPPLVLAAGALGSQLVPGSCPSQRTHRDVSVGRGVQSREALGHARSWSGESRWGVQHLAKCRGVASELTLGNGLLQEGKGHWSR